MNSLEESLRKAREHADTVYEDQKNGGEYDFNVELANIAEFHAMKGESWSSSHGRARAGAHAKHIDDLLRARLDGLVEGFSMHGVALDEKRASDMVNELMCLRDALITEASTSDGMGQVSLGIGPDQFAGWVREQSKVSRATVTAEIARRRLQRKEVKEATVTNIYHLTGVGSRVNVNSTDNSVNSISESQLFPKMREEIAQNLPSGPDRDRILEKLTALEKAPDQPTRWERYKELVGLIADHMTILGPLIPALTQWLAR